MTLTYRPGGWWAISPNGQPEMVLEEPDGGGGCELITVSDSVLLQLRSSLLTQFERVVAECNRRSEDGVIVLREPGQTIETITIVGAALEKAPLKRVLET